jgi:hypothetical protein
MSGLGKGTARAGRGRSEGYRNGCRGLSPPQIRQSVLRWLAGYKDLNGYKAFFEGAFPLVERHGYGLTTTSFQNARRSNYRC